MNKKTELLAYYQKNAKEAFIKGFTLKTHYDVVEPEVYEVHKYYLPQHASKKVKWVRRYFKYLDEQEIDITFKRRKSWVEYAETSMLMLSRIWNLCGKGHTIIAGSEHVSPIPWAIFGENVDGRMARHQFSNVMEIAEHYKNNLYGNCYPFEFHFRNGAGWAPKIASRFRKQPFNSPNFWMTIGLCLTYDLIQNCGPDCNEFFELFTNDYREHSDNFDILAWEKLRCKILGVSPKIKIEDLPLGKMKRRCRVRIEPEEIKPRKVKTEIALIFEGKSLVDGEKTRLVYEPKKEVVSVDTNSVCPLMLPYKPNCVNNVVDVHLPGISRRTHPHFSRWMDGSPDML